MEKGMAIRQEILNTALAALSSGRPGAAETELRALLSANSQDVDARYFYARSLAAQGQLERAVGEFQRLLTIRPGHVRAMVDMGIALIYLGNHQGALAVLDRAKGIDSQPAELHFALGLCHLGLGALPEAETGFRMAIARHMRIPEVYDHLGATLFRGQRYPEAVECFREAIALNPRFVAALGNLGDALMRAGDVTAAIGAYRDAVALQPDDALIHAALGTALLMANDLTSAAISLERALLLDRGLADVAVNLGTALRRLDQPDQAAAAYSRALAVRPTHAEALLELGLLKAEHGDPEQAATLLLAARDQRPQDAQAALKVAEKLDTLGRRSQALDVYEQAAQSIPANADIHDAHGLLLHRLGRYGDALACYARALGLDASRRATQLNRGHALESQGSVAEAIRCFHDVLGATPQDLHAIAGLASCAFRICDWDLAATMVARLLETPAGIDQLHPFLRFAADLEPAVLADSCCRTAGAIAERTHETPLAPYAHDKLRVAYLSPDFRQHPVAYAIAAVIERHDPRIESIGISLVAPDDSEIAVRLRSSFDEFIDGGSMSDGEIVELLRRREIDIAIDLAGFTSGARPAVFAARIAPVQVNYLGFAGSTGARFMDFMIADEVVVPVGDEHLYAEQIVRLPHSYLPFDRERTVGNSVGRIDAGLPATGFVFCAFSNGYKIAREVFEVWMTLLKEVPDSVLWLRSGAPAMEGNLIGAAGDLGVAADRLVFSPFAARMDEYLARLQLADLFLDTVPYNAHTTAAEALWAGVPVITCRGRSFAGRVGASLLTAAGLPELIGDDLDGYRDRALNLARSPAALRELRERMRTDKATSAVFDTARYVRDFESALFGMWRRA
jgi:protein O-GlcNAc transferase